MLRHTYQSHSLTYHALKRAALAGAPIVNMEPNHLALAPAAVSTAVAVTTGTQCSSCRRYHDGVEFRTCSRCLMSRKDRTLQQRIARDAAKMEGRKGKKVRGTKNWCLILDFSESQSVCRPCQEKARTAHAARRAAKRKVAQSLQFTKAWTELRHQEVLTQGEQHSNTEHNGPSFPVVQCVQLLVDAPPVEVSDLIRVCRSHEKGWYLEARVDIPAGERVAVYPVTIKADPAWPTEHLSPDKVAQQSQYLMPIYARSSKTNCEYKVKHLVGDVSQLAPVEYEGAPCVAHLANKAMSQSQVNVLYEYLIKGRLQPGTERKYDLRTCTAVAAGNELLADYGKFYPRFWVGLHNERAQKKRKDNERAQKRSRSHGKVATPHTCRYRVWDSGARLCLLF